MASGRDISCHLLIGPGASRLERVRVRGCHAADLRAQDAGDVATDSGRCHQMIVGRILPIRTSGPGEPRRRSVTTREA